MARRVTTVISLRDNYTAVMKKAARYTKAFDKDVQKMVARLDKSSKKKHDIRVKNSAAMKALNAIEKKVAPLRNVAVHVSANVARFKRDMKPVLDSNKALLGKAWKVTVKLKDGVTAGLRKLTTALKKAASIVLMGGAAAAAAAGYTINKGMELEDYQISMRHFVGVNNPGADPAAIQKQTDQYMEWLSEYAKVTPYGRGEAVGAGSRAVQVAEGNTKAAQGLVRMAGDMAALTPGKTIMDAMEALADAQMGEMERMKEFGFKISADDFKKSGYNLFSTKSVSGITLEQMFGGGAEDKGKSASGILSTLTGNIETGIQDAGLSLVNALKPLLIKMLPQSENMATKIKDMGTMLGGWITDTIPKLDQLWEDLKKFFEPIAAWASEKWLMLKPFTDFVSKAFDGVSGKGENVMDGLTSAIDKMVNTLINALNSIATNWPSIEPAVAGFVQWLPQLLLAFAGFKLLSFGIGVGKAAGSLFTGLGKFFGFGGGKTPVTPGAPQANAPTPKTTPGKVGPVLPAVGGAGKLLFPGLDTTALFGSGKMAAIVGGATTGLVAAGAASGAYAMYETFLGSKAGETKMNNALAADILKRNNIGGLDGLGYAGNVGLRGLWGSVTSGSSPVPNSEKSVAEKTNALLDDILKKNNISGLGGLKSAGNVGLKGLWDSLNAPPAPDLIPDKSIAEANAKIETFAKNAATTIDTTLPGWVNKLFGGGSINANILFTDLSTNSKGGGKGGQTEHRKNAAGIKRIPWDNFPSLLHKGEAVLPAGEAGEYRRNGNQSAKAAPQIHLTVHVNGANMDENKLTNIIVQRLSEAAVNLA